MIEPQSMQLGASAWVWNETLVAPPKFSVIGAVPPPFPLAALACPFPFACPFAPVKAPLVAMTANGSATGSEALTGAAGASSVAETAVALGAVSVVAVGR